MQHTKRPEYDGTSEPDISACLFMLLGSVSFVEG